MKATRDAFGEALKKYSSENFIVLGADLSGATKTSEFAKKYPHRYFECGISEMNMIGVAAGLAAAGNKVIISSFGSFLTGRYDQIRCSIAFPNLPVILVGTHSGISPNMDGPTQSAYEDISLMRSLPNFKVIQPASAYETEVIVENLLTSELEGPVYLRIGRQPVPDSHLDLFMPVPVPKKLIVSSGCLLETVHSIAEEYKIPYVSISKLKPFDSTGIDKFQDIEEIITVEDHSVIGGLGTIVSEYISSQGLPIKVTKLGIPDLFPSAGPPAELYDTFIWGPLRELCK